MKQFFMEIIEKLHMGNTKYVLTYLHVQLFKKELESELMFFQAPDCLNCTRITK